MKVFLTLILVIILFLGLFVWTPHTTKARKVAGKVYCAAVSVSLIVAMWGDGLLSPKFRVILLWVGHSWVVLFVAMVGLVFLLRKISQISSKGLLSELWRWSNNCILPLSLVGWGFSKMYFYWLFMIYSYFL